MKFKLILAFASILAAVLVFSNMVNPIYAANPTPTANPVATYFPPLPTLSPECGKSPQVVSFTKQGNTETQGWLAVLESDHLGCPISVAKIGDALPAGPYVIGVLPVPGFFPGNVGWTPANTQGTNLRLGVGQVAGVDDANKPQPGDTFWIYDQVPPGILASTSKVYLYFVAGPDNSGAADAAYVSALKLPGAWGFGCRYDWIKQLDPEACDPSKEIRAISAQNPVALGDFKHPIAFNLDPDARVGVISLMGPGNLISAYAGNNQLPNVINIPEQGGFEFDTQPPQGEAWSILERWTQIIVFVIPKNPTGPAPAAGADTQIFCQNDGNVRTQLRDQGFDQGERYCKQLGR